MSPIPTTPIVTKSPAFVARPAARDAAMPDPSPLTEAHFRIVRQVVAARGPVRRAAKTARGSAFTILVVGVVSIPIALIFPTWLGIVVVTGICTIGVREYIGAGRMRRAEPSAAAYLGSNQLAFVALIVVYCVIQMATSSPAEFGSTAISSELRTSLAQLPEMQSSVEELIGSWAPLAVYGFYSLVILLSIGFQGGLALYYFTRKRHLEAARQVTPPWVERLLAESGA